MIVVPPVADAPRPTSQAPLEAGWLGLRDVFVTFLREQTKAGIGPRDAGRVDEGHVVVRVAPGGATYRVFVVDDRNGSGAVKSVHGPYTSGAR